MEKINKVRVQNITFLSQHYFLNLPAMIKTQYFSCSIDAANLLPQQQHISLAAELLIFDDSSIPPLLL